MTRPTVRATLASLVVLAIGLVLLRLLGLLPGDNVISYVLLAGIGVAAALVWAYVARTSSDT